MLDALSSSTPSRVLPAGEGGWIVTAAHAAADRNASRYASGPNADLVMLRSAIAHATHLAVCELHDDGGQMHCAAYAILGSIVASVSMGVEYFPQCGTLAIMTSEADDGGPPWWAAMDAETGGIEQREFHAWFGAVPNKVTPEIVDLSARHYPHICNHLARQTRTPQLRWPEKRQAPPYIWSDQELPPWLVLKSNRDEMMALRRLYAPGGQYCPMTVPAVAGAIQRAIGRVRGAA
jgi:hypothetical protein